MDFTINSQSIDNLAAAINALANAVSGQKCSRDCSARPSVAAPAHAPQAAEVPTSIPQMYSAPAQPVSMYTAPAVPVATAVAASQQYATGAANPAPAPALPTQEKAYTLQDLAVAGTVLTDNGRSDDLRNLLAQFGVRSLPELTPDRFGAFAMALRSMGAPI